jgi:DNA adenine methylase
MASFRRSSLAKPFLKWAGGKRQLLPEITKHIPKFNTYYEPFVGAGAVLFELQPQKAVINDSNSELMNCYQVIKDNLDDLLADLQKHKNNENYYYRIRKLDRNVKEYNKLTPVEKASRIIFLNKTCYNGLFRVNSQGQFNVPFGRYKNPNILNKAVLKAVHRYLNKNDVKILNEDFETAVQDGKKGDFVYFDPPYDPVSDTASFTGYDINGFDRNEQKRLKKVYDRLTEKGVKCLLSNSATDFILDLYSKYKPILIVSASRNINSVAEKRGKISEVLVKNW